MNWWTSIAFYLWQNSFRRWLEQPLALLAKLTISALIGMLGALMILGAGFLGDEISKQLASRDALMISIYEVVSPRQANASLALADAEPKAWASLASEIIVYDQISTMAELSASHPISVMAMRDPEALGYPDSILLLSNRRVPDSTVVVTMHEHRFQATVVAPITSLIQQAMGDNEWILASTHRLAPLLQDGFTRNVLMQARSIDEIERAHAITDTLRGVEGRQIIIRSALPLLLELRQIRMLQRYVLFAVTLGTVIVLGLICGALAWMEFREERYLLALIRSFGVGRAMLLYHAVAENCLVAVTGVLAGLTILSLIGQSFDLSSFQMGWLTDSPVLFRRETWVLLIGALFGGLLSCVPVGIGLRKPLGLVLK